MCVHHNRAAPVQSHKIPCQRSAYNRYVDEAWGNAVAEIGRAEVEKIDDEKQLREPEV